ncbi:TVP38/TMEM64 family protein [Aetokthonos hydrillicola Thurmond2011]|jgi:uncharacterized membrane protein YdjX (TVP38/TMEM64 family)|uniref:TVP38/TMEM64 family membrane protein n=1 Tax=Aetokthonos hydrillicola Thurmond2011 TaxID=2712845 RepID=A0AAP5MAS4_9CYAN|nr:TVP38/TMEM64 family protein [Aetokthonos hydrillicola]MBO3462484.1 TVP38/TMEM64 family protein [Aetokthonos hydrillicola CCALA 1050]MBW4588682.1 TVP38/TMEM64 family protein [Aetokthonos hydrillicola CCALA 1050]MDR9895984.1 TVP38/TMEM64 family protein [Aetokthonos hydrillicola Thurmond2011]
MIKKLYSQFGAKTKLVLLICLIITLTIVAKQLNFQDFLLMSLLWIKSLGWLAPIGFIIIYNLATILFIPGSILTIGGGVLFGVFWGSIYVFIAATFGATFAFLIGRYISRNWVTKQIERYPKFKMIDRAVTKEGWKIVLLTRLSPVFPFNLLNYAFGLTEVSLKDYILGSIGMIPGTVMYVNFGSLAGNLAIIGKDAHAPNPAGNWAIRIVGFIATVALTVYVTRIARQALEQEVS